MCTMLLVRVGGGGGVTTRQLLKLGNFSVREGQGTNDKHNFLKL